MEKERTKKIVINLLKEKTCDNCVWKNEHTTSWCGIQGNKPSAGTCIFWRMWLPER